MEVAIKKYIAFLIYFSGEILEFLKDKIASWWMPDDVVFVDSLPHTATGKIQKLVLREQFKDYKLEVE